MKKFIKIKNTHILSPTTQFIQSHSPQASETPFGRTLASIFPEALVDLIEKCHQRFSSRRELLLAEREIRQKQFDEGAVPYYLSKETLTTAEDWKIAPVPSDCLERIVEITGPVNDPKMVINMLSRTPEGAKASTAMLDFEDSMCPTWENILSGYQNVYGAVRGELAWKVGEKTYELNKTDMVKPMVRVRGLHLNDCRYLIERGESQDKEIVSGGLLDFVVCAFHNAKMQLDHHQTPMFYIPKCEHYLEAKWWDDLISFVEQELRLPHGSLRITLLIETLPAAFQMEEILLVTKDHALGLNVGRWDKIFSDIKTLKMHPDAVLSDRSKITMQKYWMENYAKRLIKICHTHGAFAIGGMAAFTPGKDEATRKMQTEKVYADKLNEAHMGHDGCWVSHPYFISFARQAFTESNQLNVMLSDFPLNPDLIPQGEAVVTEEGVRTNIRVGLAYMKGWNDGMGCVSFDNLMEDLATLEISRAQVWQWLYHGVQLKDSEQLVSPSYVKNLFAEEYAKLIEQTHVTREDKEEWQKWEKAYADASTLFLEKELRPFLQTDCR